MRRSSINWLQTEIRRLTGEIAILETTIPPSFYPALQERLNGYPLPQSCYTGGVDEISGNSCTSCPTLKKSLTGLLEQARLLDSNCKARIEFHRNHASSIEGLMIEKRRVEEKMFFSGTGGDGVFTAITKVNQSDDTTELLERLEQHQATLNIADEFQRASNAPRAPRSARR
eukprot:gnl/MRDRNA2_/MRDRNA2_154562_c0_seq1.p1 gnl/MRDRNA2_/MRDRNA2_154562_c0~~gnl/MRDRNA2_/MRDRNA2_154562_c0_seq1.p1  ORF type:complete len:172 (-),score=20.67 gnl/MRDRNA2_/MRDRNA2_154562_c0_seq1:84-599(-)